MNVLSLFDGISVARVALDLAHIQVKNYYASEKEKRSRFTYNLGEIALQGKAKTSLERARFFNQEIKQLIP